MKTLDIEVIDSVIGVYKSHIGFKRKYASYMEGLSDKFRFLKSISSSKPINALIQFRDSLTGNMVKKSHVYVCFFPQNYKEGSATDKARIYFLKKFIGVDDVELFDHVIRYMNASNLLYGNCLNEIISRQPLNDYLSAISHLQAYDIKMDIWMFIAILQSYNPMAIALSMISLNTCLLLNPKNIRALRVNSRLIGEGDGDGLLSLVCWDLITQGVFDDLVSYCTSNARNDEIRNYIEGVNRQETLDFTAVNLLNHMTQLRRNRPNQRQNVYDPVSQSALDLIKVRRNTYSEKPSLKNIFADIRIVDNIINAECPPSMLASLIFLSRAGFDIYDNDLVELLNKQGKNGSIVALCAFAISCYNTTKMFDINICLPLVEMLAETKPINNNGIISLVYLLSRVKHSDNMNMISSCKKIAQSPKQLNLCDSYDENMKNELDI